MGARWIWAIIALAIISLLLSLVGPWNAKARSAQMGTSIENALSAAGYDFANVDMSGNVATLTGEASSQEVMNQALSLAESTPCETCKNKSKIWHQVRSDMTVRKAPTVPTVSPYVFRAVKDQDGNVTVDGYVRSVAERDRILREAEALFPGRVTDNKVKIAQGAPGDGWGDVISTSLTDLQRLDYGTARLSDMQTLIQGYTTDVGIRDLVNVSVGNLPDGFNGAANITVPNVEAVNVGEVRSEGMCQNLFNNLKGDTKINFAIDKAEIRGAQSFDLLNNLASAANQCSAFRIRVEGHTDSDGADDYNQWLSEARANTVVAYLADAGVEPSRMAGVGYGETKPVATNDTPAGKAANRRIEFIVTTSE